MEAKLSVLNLATVEIKDKDISGLTDTTVLQYLETKRAQHQHLVTPHGLQHKQSAYFSEGICTKKNKIEGGAKMADSRKPVKERV